MNNQISEILKELIRENGIDLCNNKIKLKGLLFDLCGDSKKEINILIIAIQYNIIYEILCISENTIDDFTYNRFVNKLCVEAGTDKKVTLWAVKCWIEALGKELNSINPLNSTKSNIPIYLDRLYICPLNESILKMYSFESMSQYVARIENMQCVAFGKAKLIKHKYDINDAIFSLEVKWDKWIKHKGILNENCKLSITVDRTIATSLYNSSKEFPLNGKLQIVQGSIKIKEASIVALGKIFSVNFNTERDKVKRHFEKKQETWSYLIEGGLIYKINIAGTKKIKLNDDKSILIKVIGEWIYYCNETDGYKLYKIKIDGTSKTLISEDRTLNINIMDNWLFYSNGSDYFKIYKIKIDGSQKSILSGDVSADLRLIGDWIYYTNYLDRRKTYKIKIDGTEKSAVDEEVEL
ncbi:MAG: DUF5050 domain-containing protein [Clostridiaceae bacterium]|nr:DUF5050 domain-containing protein [Clostridiaceae bacterium]